MVLRYDKIIQQALVSVSSGPWAAEDLERAREVMDEDLCRLHGPDCTLSEVTGWLDSLTEEQREEVLFEVNANWSDGQEPWALS
jgi:hypothetical protein